MADNPTPEQNESQGGGNKTLVMIAIVNMLLIMGLMLYIFVFKKDPPPQIIKNDMTQTDQKKNINDDADEDNREIGELFDMKNIVVNLNEPGGNRMLKLSLSLEYKNKKLKDILKKRDAQIRNEIIIYLSSLTFAQTAGLGKKNISKTLKKKINSLLAEGKIKEVYFKEFVVQ